MWQPAVKRKVVNGRRPAKAVPHRFNPKSDKLQRNAIRNILSSSGAQAKLTIGQPNDKYEQEADRVADQVMSMSDADVAQRVETGTVQPMQIQRMCPECENDMAQRQPMEEDEEMLQPKLRDESLQRQPLEEEEEEELQAKEMPGQTPTVTPNLESRINSLKGGGQPLDSDTRSFFEPRFGHDFSKVRVHTDDASADAAKSINARAFTLGNHVVMGAGQYQPKSQQEKRLLGHELTHVVQQGRGGLSHIQMLGGGPDNYGVPDRADIDNWEGERRSSDAEAVRTADSSSDISMIRFFDSATVERRMELIDIILNDWWVGPINETALERIWSSFGNSESLIYVVGINKEYAKKWHACLDRGMDPSNIHATGSIRRAFESDVKALARDYMQGNLEDVHQEQSRFGFRISEGGQSPTHETEEALRLEETQELARSAELLLQAQEQLREQVIGFMPIIRNGHEGWSSVTFEPDFNPQVEKLGASHSWNEVNEQWTQVSSALSAITAQSPTVYAAIAQGRENVQALANEDAESARATAQRVLIVLEANIQSTLPKIDNGDLDWQDLVPIHQQLYLGRVRGVSGIGWSNDVEKSVAEDAVGDHEIVEFWEALGLGSAAAALFIVSSITTGGVATVALIGGLAASGAQAAISWENYEDLATAAASASSKETSLVSEGQVDAALLQAIMDTVFLFLDMAIPVVEGWRAGQTAAKLEKELLDRSAAVALEQVSEGGVVGAQALQRGISELGVRETMERTSKSLDEMVALISEYLEGGVKKGLLDRIEAARRIGLDTIEEAGQAGIRTLGTAAENTWIGGRTLHQLVSDIPAAIVDRAISKDFGDHLLAEAIERIGPATVVREGGGWKRLSLALSDKSATGELLMQWRNSVFDDLETFVQEVAEGKVQRTGTTGNFSNDIDMSFVGSNAAEARQKAMSYLAHRLGVENSPKAFDRMMMAGLFTDPTRIHAYDTLPSAIREMMARRQASLQEQLIWNRRVYEALDAGDQQMVEALRDMMREHSIPEFAFRPLSSGDVTHLSQRMDRLHIDLLQALEHGDLAAQEKIAKQLAEGQSLINAAESGGYYSSGGVRRYVSERPGEIFFERIGGSAIADQATPMAERFTAMLDQLPKLDEGRMLLQSVTDNEIVSGVRSIGKYGERLLEVSAEFGDGFILEGWVELVEECRSLKAAADSGDIASRLSVGEAEQIIRRADSAFQSLIEASSGVLKEVRIASEMPEIGNAAAQLQQMTLAHVRLLRATDWATRNMHIRVRAIRLGVAFIDLTEAEVADNSSGK